MTPHAPVSPLCRTGFFEQQRQKDLDDKRAQEKARKKELRKQVNGSPPVLGLRVRLPAACALGAERGEAPVPKIWICDINCL